MADRLPYTTGDAVADLHRIADERRATTWVRGAMIVCFEAERKINVPVQEAFNEALRQLGRQAHAG